MIRTISLNKLVPSPRNVRRRTDEQADLALKADIEARGLLQNLVVTNVRKPRGSFAVEAGERRRRALQTLADEGKLPADHEVCCLVIEGAAEAQEASLAENFQRLSMNPADECLARLERAPSERTIFGTDSPAAANLVGRVVERGLSDELRDLHYLIIDGIDGRAHYVDLGRGERTEPLPLARLRAFPAACRTSGRRTGRWPRSRQLMAGFTPSIFTWSTSR